MRTHTNEFKQEIKKLGRQINGKIYVYSNYDLSSENNNNILTEDDIQIISEKFNKQEATEIDSNLIYSMNIIKNGNLLKSLMKEFDFEAKYDLNIGTAVNPHFGLLVNNSYEYLDYGDYIIYSKEYNLDSETWNYVCYDMMLYSMIKYTPIKDITYPTTIRNYISVIADKMGVEFANKEDEFVNYDQLVNEELFKDKGYTLRDILDKLSEVTASNIIINDNNELEIKYPEKNITEEKTVEGTNISISDNVGDTISDLQLQGNTYQQTYTGKNLYGLSVASGTGLGVTRSLLGSEILLNGTTSGSGNIYNDNTKKITLPTGTYTFSSKILSGTRTANSKDTAIYLLNVSGTSVVWYANSGINYNRTQTITFSKTTELFLRIYTNGSGMVFNNLKIGLQIEKGSSSSTYEPYVGNQPSPNPDYPQPIENVTGRQTIDVVGKNLLDISDITNTGEITNNGDGSITLDGTIHGGTSYSLTKPFTLKANTTYTLSLTNTNSSYSAGTFILRNGNTNIFLINYNVNSANYTPTKDVVIDTLRIYGAGLTFDNYTFSVQLEKGSTATTYEEYKGQSYEINLGKNLFDKDNANILNAYFNLQQGIVSNNDTRSIYIKCQPNTTYTIQKSGSVRFRIGTTSSVPNVGTSILNITSDDTANVLTITTPSNAQYLIAYIYGGFDTNPKTFDEVLETVQIEYGSTASSYSSYFTPIELNKIGNYQDSIKKSTGKNLFDISTTPFITRVAYNSSGVQQDWDNYSGTTTKTKVQPNTTYTLSENRNAYTTQIVEYDSTGTFITRQLLSNYGKTFTTGNNTYLINISISDETIPTLVQLEKGSTITSYEPYLQIDTWYIEKKIGKYIFDGSTNAFGYSSSNSVFVTDTLATLIKKNTTMIANYYNQVDNITTYANMTTGQMKLDGTNSGRIIIKDTRYTSANDYKIWLQSNNLILYYILNTPTYTEITNTDLINQLESIELLNGINNIMVSSGDLVGGLKIKYVSEYETINEEYLKDINVAFGEQFGPINRVSIADSEDNYEYYAEDMTSISKNKKTQINIIDNEFVFNDDTQTICQAIFNKLNGLNYSLNDFATTGVCYYDFLDIYNVQAKGNTYQCLLLNNEISINQGIEENIFTEEPENNEKSSNNYETSILSNKAVTFKINQQEKRLEQAVMEDNVIASLNLAIEDGQGVIEIKGNQVTIESDNFILDADGSIEATAGEIGGYSIGTNQLSTQISKTYTFTQDDVNTVRNIILGNIQPTEEQIAKYDVNGNGCIEISDLAIIVSIVSGGGTKTFTGEISINNDDFNRVIKVTNSDGIKNSIGMLGSYFSYLGAKAIDLQNSSNQRCEIMPNEIYLVDYSGSSPSSTTITAQGILSPTITQTSLESAKKNFELLENALEIIKNIDIYKYQLKIEEDAAKKHIGFIIGDDYKYSEEVTSNENNGVDIYSFVSVCCKAIKEQQEIIDKMQQEIEFLKKESGK